MRSREKRHVPVGYTDTETYDGNRFAEGGRGTEEGGIDGESIISE